MINPPYGEAPPWIKICGVRDERTALSAQAAGATAVGFVFAPSPRRTDVPSAREIAAGLRRPLARVGVFTDAPVAEIVAIAREVGLTHVQLHGRQDAGAVLALQAQGLRVIKAVRVREPASLADVDASGALEADLVLLDTYARDLPGGTGRTFDWRLAAAVAARRRIVLAGGLTPGNVGEAIRTVRPFGVDVSSGVERAPGEKDPAKVASFVDAARRAWQATVRHAACERREVMDRVRRAT